MSRGARVRNFNLQKLAGAKYAWENTSLNDINI